MRKITSQGHETFKQCYNNLPRAVAVSSPKQEFITRIATITERSETTVRLWLNGTNGIDKLCKRIIAEELKQPVEILFPEEEVVCEQ